MGAHLGLLNGMKILIVKPSSLGDIIHTLPVVPMIRRNLPDAVISWVVNEEYARLLDLSPDIDNVIIFRRNYWNRLSKWPNLVSFARELKQLEPDLALDFQGLFRSGLICSLSGAARRVGWRSAREGAIYFYNERILLPANLEHAVEKNFFLLQSALQIDDSVQDSGLSCSEIDVRNSRRLLKKHGIDCQAPLLIISPSARWDSKIWPSDFFAKVVEKVWRNLPELNVLLVGQADERSLGEMIEETCGGQGKIVNLMGETELGTLVALLRHSNVVLTNDSGPMHLAAAVETPVVALFGPTDPRKTGPYGEIHKVFQGECDQGPCQQRVCRKGTNECHAAVSSTEVANAVQAGLGWPD